MRLSIRPFRPLSPRRLRILAGAVLVCASVVAIAALSLDVHRKLTALQRANSDNVLWVLAQAEVELLRLQTSAQETLLHPDRRLDDLRRRFDVFYSRVRIFQESPVYAPVMQEPRYRPTLEELRRFMDQAVPLIDGPDSELRAGLVGLLADMPRLHTDLRGLANRAMLDMAAQTEAQRIEISRTLARLAGVTFALVLTLSLLTLALMRMERASKEQAALTRQTGARLATVVDASVDGILVTDADGQILEANPAALAMFGMTRADLLGRRALETLAPPGEVAGLRERIAQARARLGAPGAQPLRLELELRRANGERFPTELTLADATARKSGDQDESINVIVAFLRDISDRRDADRRLNAALEQARAGEKAKANFLAVMSHEMRTPLNGLMGSAELLSETDLDAEQRRLVSVLTNSGRILLGHVNSVLDAARSEAGEIPLVRRATDLDRLIGDCVANQAGLASAAGNRIRVRSLSGPLGVSVTDPARLSQILLNLIGNAVKFTRDGTITIETEVMRPASGGAGDRLVEFRVIDTGAGIPEDQLDRIFEDFVTLDAGYTRQADGTGLGLGIARRLVRAMGGDIGAESVLGEGSLFWVRLPLPPPGAARGEAGAPDSPPEAAVAASGQDILVIEDNAINRFILRSHLEAAGHRVTEAADGLEGVALAGNRRFDVILTDISMPRMDGVEAVRRIRAGHEGGASQAARILAVTAHAMPEERAGFRAAGMDGCLAKPVSRRALLAMIDPAFTGDEPPAPAIGPPVGLDTPTGRAPLDVLDRDRLEILAAQIGAPRLSDLIGQMLEEGARTVARLADLAAADRRAPDPLARDEIDRLCHRLAGSSATFGADPLGRLLERMRPANAEDRPAAEDLAALPGLWSDTAAALEAYRAGLAATT